MKEDLLTIQEVAAQLRVNESTIRRWIKNGSLKAITLPHRGKREIYRVKQSTLAALLHPGEQPAPESGPLTGAADPLLKLHLNEERLR